MYPIEKRVVYVANRVPTQEAHEACQRITNEISGLIIMRAGNLQSVFQLLTIPNFKIDFVVIDIEECDQVESINMWQLIGSLNTLAKFETATNGKRPTFFIAGVNDTTPVDLIRQAKRCKDFVALNPILGGRFTFEMCLASMRRYTNWDWTEPKCITDKLKKKKITEPMARARSLTGRQREILDMITRQGLSNKQIGRLLHIADSTVKIHVSHLMRKYGCRNRTQLAIYRDRLVA